MEEIGIPAQHMIQYAQAMAETLAIMHWLAKIDANDVEFVLAPPDDEDEGQWVNVLGEHTMWILDFDLCRSMAMDEHGIEQAARAFWRNDHSTLDQDVAVHFGRHFRNTICKSADR
jgi:hypothetical protein